MVLPTVLRSNGVTRTDSSNADTRTGTKKKVIIALDIFVCATDKKKGGISKKQTATIPIIVVYVRSDKGVVVTTRHNMTNVHY